MMLPRLPGGQGPSYAKDRAMLRNTFLAILATTFLVAWTPAPAPIDVGNALATTVAGDKDSTWAPPSYDFNDATDSQGAGVRPLPPRRSSTSVAAPPDNSCRNNGSRNQLRQSQCVPNSGAHGDGLAVVSFVDNCGIPNVDRVACYIPPPVVIPPEPPVLPQPPEQPRGDILLEPSVVVSIDGLELPMLRENGDYGLPINKGLFDALGAPYTEENVVRTVLQWNMSRGGGSQQNVTRNVTTLRVTRASLDAVYAVSKRYTYPDIYGPFDATPGLIYHMDNSPFAQALRGVSAPMYHPTRRVGKYAVQRCAPGSFCLHETLPK
jgi:hypothetical protein